MPSLISYQCDDNRNCTTICYEGVCSPYLQVGEECAESDQCIGSVTCGSGICGGDSATCTNDDDCVDDCLPEGRCGIVLIINENDDPDGADSNDGSESELPASLQQDLDETESIIAG